MDEHVHFDPSSISLFSANAVLVDYQTRSTVSDERLLSSTSQNISQKPMGTEQSEHVEADGSFSTYQRRKNMEVMHRRNLIDRLDKLKSTQGPFFTVPQLKVVSNSQLSIFLRRLLKSPDIKQHISTELLKRIITVEESDERSPDAAKIMHRIQGELGQFAEGMPPNGIPEMHRILEQRMDEEDDRTEEEVSEFEEDDDIFGTPDEFSVELLDLLEQEVQILTADRRAINTQSELRRLIEFAEKQLDKVEQEEGQCIYEQPTHNSNDNHLVEENEQNGTMKGSARCRALLSGSRRAVVRHEFDSSRKEQRKRPIIAKKRCSIGEYAFVDDSIHSQLSLSSAIPLDAQIMKYLHVADFIPIETEMRRFKTAQLTKRGYEHCVLQHTFYDLEEDFREDDDDKFGNAESKGIKISLPFHKMMRKHDHDVIMDKNAEQTDTESDPDDFDYGADSSSPREMGKSKRRRMTYSSGTAKPPKLENRRTSHVEFGSSMYDYDAQVMDIGLPLPTIQKVESVEIVIPSFRKKCGLSSDCFPSSNDCERCRVACEWDDTRRLHAELEQQEKNLRFRPPLGSTVSRKPMAHLMEIEAAKIKF